MSTFLLLTDLFSGKDTLHCRACNVTLHFVCAFQAWQGAQFNKVCEEFGVQIQTKHLEVCPRFNRPFTEDTIFGGRVSLIYDKSDFVETFFGLLKKFGKDKVPVIEVPGNVMVNLMPVFNVILKSAVDYKHNTLRPATLSTASELAPELTTATGTALILSLFGWRLGTDTLPTVHCKLCLRTLGLWNFRQLNPELGSRLVDVTVCDRAWEDSSSYLLNVESSVLSSRDLCSANNVSGVGKLTDDDDVEMTDLSVLKTDNLKGQEPVINKLQLHTRNSYSKEDVVYGNPDIFLPMLYKDDDEKHVESKPAEKDDKILNGQTCLPQNERDRLISPVKSHNDSSESPKQSEFKTPSTRVLRSRSISTPGKGTPNSTPGKGTPNSTPGKGTPNSTPGKETPNSRKRKTIAVELPTSPIQTSESPSSRRRIQSGELSPTSGLSCKSQSLKRQTRSGETPNISRKTRSSEPASLSIKSSEPAKSPAKQTSPTPCNKASTPRDTEEAVQSTSPPGKRSKLEMIECVVSEVMKRQPSQLDLSVANPVNLNVVKQHHYWCPWVCKLPAYRLSRRGSPSKQRGEVSQCDYSSTQQVSVVEQCQSPGWTTLLAHLNSVNKSPGNAWIAVHNMLQDCVRKSL